MFTVNIISIVAVTVVAYSFLAAVLNRIFSDNAKVPGRIYIGLSVIGLILVLVYGLGLSWLTIILIIGGILGAIGIFFLGWFAHSKKR
jgi:hypothetical protein